MKTVGIVGSRGMVGKVLLERMKEEGDLEDIQLFLLSTSQSSPEGPYYDACDMDLLLKLDVIITTQGSDYTHKIYPLLKERNYQGFWIDAASALRLHPESTLLLDPLNSASIENALNEGKKLFVGSNCTVSLMLLALKDLIPRIEWINATTYQAISGAGSKATEQLISDYQTLNPLHFKEEWQKLRRTPLAYNLIPAIDDFSAELPESTKEEVKAQIESEKILEGKKFHIESTCVRISSLRCHSQALTLKLKENLSLEEVENLLKKTGNYLHYVPNKQAETIKELHPAYFQETLKIGVGRLKKLHLEEENHHSSYFSLFTIGDQLLWGAAEPLRRMFLKIKTGSFE